jgi:molybdate transport system substrate-binding protein
MAIGRIAATAFAGMLSLSTGSTAASAAEITVFAGLGVKAAFVEIVPLFERTTGHKVNITYAGGPPLVQNIRAGTTGDLLIVPDENSDQLLKEGKLVDGSRIAFAHASMSVAVRAGAPKPDISSLEAFKDTLLRAKSVSYNLGAGGVLFESMVEQRLGIGDEVKAKRVTLQVGGEPVGVVVARGDAEIGVTQLGELLPITGIDIVGPVPSQLQRPIVFSATMFPNSRQQETAKAFVNFLRSNAAASILKKWGLDAV